MTTIERRGEIGVLRAVGIHRNVVLRTILAKAAVLGAIGGSFGAVLSLGVGLLMNDLLFDDPSLVFTWNSARYLVYGFRFGASLVTASIQPGKPPTIRQSKR